MVQSLMRRGVITASVLLALTPLAAEPFTITSEEYAAAAEEFLDQPLRVEYQFTSGYVYPTDDPNIVIVSRDGEKVTFEQPDKGWVAYIVDGEPQPYQWTGWLNEDAEGNEVIETRTVSRVWFIQRGGDFIFEQKFEASDAQRVAVDSAEFTGQWSNEPTLSIAAGFALHDFAEYWPGIYLAKARRGLENIEEAENMTSEGRIYSFRNRGTTMTLVAEQEDGMYLYHEWSVRSEGTRRGQKQSFGEFASVDGVVLPGWMREDFYRSGGKRDVYEEAQNITVTPITEAEWQAELERVRATYFADEAEATDSAAGQ